MDWYLKLNAEHRDYNERDCQPKAYTKLEQVNPKQDLSIHGLMDDPFHPHG